MITHHSGLLGKVSKLTYFQLEQGCEDVCFLDHAVLDCEHSLNSILTDCTKTPGLGASFDEPDVMTSSVSSGFLSLVYTISDNSKLQLALSIKSHKLWCQALALLLPIPLIGTM